MHCGIAFSVLGAGMVIMRPFGVLLVTGRLEGGGCNEGGSRLSGIGEDVKSWKWDASFQIWICGTRDVVIR